MLVRYTGGSHTDLFKEHDRFILLVFVDLQLDFNPGWNLSLSPSFSTTPEQSNHHVEIMKNFPDVVYVETMHSESYDMINNFGFDYDNEIMDLHNGHYKPMIVGVKKGRVVSHSIGRCYCAETYVDIIHSLYPELFEPTSVSES